MVSKPVAPFCLPPSPQPALRLIETSLSLWLASVRQTFFPALLCGLAGLLPGIGLGNLIGSILRQTMQLLAQDYIPWLPLESLSPQPDAFAIVLAWIIAPRTWLLLGTSMLLMLIGITVLTVRQGLIAQGSDPGAMAAARIGLTRTPACIGAWLIYSAVLLLLTLPLVALFVAIFVASVGTQPTGLLMLLLVFLVGSLLLSVPLAWASIAFGFAPFCCAIDGDGPVAAQARSRRLVRGHWTHAAIVLSVPMLIYLGAGSAISSLTLVLAGGFAYASGGWNALLDGDWLLWSQLLAVIPTAMVLPLAFAGGVAGLHDLRGRWQCSVQPSANPPN